MNEQTRKADIAQATEARSGSGIFANLRPCLIGMEACGSAHYWARKLEALGHTMRLMASQFVNPMSEQQKLCTRCRGDLRGGDSSLTAKGSPSELRAEARKNDEGPLIDVNQITSPLHRRKQATSADQNH